jgi:hypothetical protein
MLNNEEFGTAMDAVYDLLTPLQRNFILRAVEAHVDEIVEELYGADTCSKEELDEILELELLR